MDQLPPSHRPRVVFLWISALGVVAAIALGHAVILPFLMAALLGYVLFPLVRRIERLRAPRWAAILIVYVATIGAGVAFAWSVVPRLIGETKSLAENLPAMTARLRNEWLPKIDARMQNWTSPQPVDSAPPADSAAAQAPAPIVVTRRGHGSYEIRFQDDIQLRPTHDGSWLVAGKHEEARGFSSERALRDAFDRSIAHFQADSTELVQVGRQILGGISRGIFYFFITLMLAGYMMFSYERIHGFLREMWPPGRRSAFDAFAARLDRSLAGVVRGQLLICLVNGGLSAVGLSLFHVKYWPVLAIIAAMMSIVPIFGSILSSVPAVALALGNGLPTAVAVLLWIVGIHQLEANFLNPKIIGDQAHIHPVLVVFALLVGESLFSITGALLAVPCLAIIQAVFLHFRESVLGLKEEAAAAGGVSTLTVDSRDATVEEAPAIDERGQAKKEEARSA